MRAATVLGVVSAFLLSASVHADDLEVGDPAPSVEIEEWIQGETLVGEGNPYIVEFWATWCVPCRKSIPELNELYKRYRERGLTVIGISDEVKSVSKVRSFVKKQGDRMSYPVAIDGGAKDAWFKAAGRSGIPSAFIVDAKNTIVWIGNPLSRDFVSIVDKVVEGRYDPKLERMAKPKLEAAARAEKRRNWRDAYRHLDEVIGEDPTVFFAVAADKYRIMACEEGNADEAASYGSSMIRTYRKDVPALRDLATMFASSDEKCLLAPALARKAADALVSLEGDDSPLALSVSAMVAYRQDDLTRAVKDQRRAWRLALPDEKPRLKRDLDLYTSAAERDGGG